MPEKPVMHGMDHRPGGFDPTPAGPWHLVGGPDVFADGTTVEFVNGANMAATVDIPNPAPMQFRLAVGPPNLLNLDYATGRATGIKQYTKHQVEIQGDVTDVAPGDIVFVLPLEYRLANDAPIHAHDDSGQYVACRLLSTGELIYGVP